jgi:glycerol-3-phosphate acyltransferase PlsY
VVTWVVIAYFFRFSSLASLAAALFAPLYYMFGDGVAWLLNRWILMAVVVMSVLLMWRHAENIARLIKGTESRLGKKKS